MKNYEIIPSILQRIVWMPIRLLFTVFCSLEIKGMENLKRVQSNVILASNHISELDPIIIASSLPFFSRHLPLFFTSREKEFYKNKGWKKYIYGGIFFKMWGAYPAYPGLNDYSQALRHHLEIMQDGNTVSIFPSGKRVFRGEAIEAKGGASFLTQATRLPIIPVLIQGAEHISMGEFFLRKRKIKIVFGKPLYAKDIFKNPGSYEAASAVIMEKILQLS